jgi:hypothetical protein
VFAGTSVELGVETMPGASRATALFWWSKPVDLAYVPYEWAALAYYAGAHGVRPWG